MTWKRNAAHGTPAEGAPSGRRSPRRRRAVGLEVPPKHRLITEAAKLAPHASGSPGEAQAGGEARVPGCAPRLSREAGPRTPGAGCPHRDLSAPVTD